MVGKQEIINICIYVYDNLHLSSMYTCSIHDYKHSMFIRTYWYTHDGTGKCHRYYVHTITIS